MKYCIAFHLVNGREVRATLPPERTVNIEECGDALARELASHDFLHFVEDGKLYVVNLRHVVYFRIFKVED